MAKVSGPLFSMEASGAYGGVIVFAKWKGRAYGRQLVKPANPNSANQESARNRLRTTGGLQLWANVSIMTAPGQTIPDKHRIMGKTPGGFAWNGYLVETIIGKGGMTYAAASDAYEALTSGQQDAWNTAAAALTPPLADIYQTSAGGTAATPLPKGKAWFIYQYGLAQMGLATTPGATPPAYSA